LEVQSPVTTKNRFAVLWNQSKFPLWLTGDRITGFGKIGSKEIDLFFTDPIHQKEYKEKFAKNHLYETLKYWLLSIVLNEI